MAKPIKDTPILEGRDIENFLWHMDHPTPMSESDKQLMREAHSMFKHCY